MKLEITFELESSHHDGYCSGDECVYTSEVVTKTVDLTKILESLTDEELLKKMKHVSKAKYDPNITEEEFFAIEHILAELDPGIGCTGSGYCRLSEESKEHGLDVHESRIHKIISVQRKD